MATISSVANAADSATDWRFSALLDGKPIGTHRFTLTAAEDGSRQLLSDATFDVKLLGFTVYHYRHHTEERWLGNCLASISANTNDDGKSTTVTGEGSATGFTVTSRAGKTPATASARGCVMSFAYWNHDLANQRRLLDPGTGRIEPVTITSLPTSSIEVHGQHVAVSGLHITGLPHPIDVWYVGEQWVGLDTSVEGGRKLTYRMP